MKKDKRIKLIASTQSYKGGKSQLNKLLKKPRLYKKRIIRPKHRGLILDNSIGDVQLNKKKEWPTIMVRGQPLYNAIETNRRKH